MNILFINACMRGENQSRTLKICRKFIEAYKASHPDDTVSELDLTHSGLKPVDAEYAAMRTALIESGNLDNEIFSYARQFAEADKIIIGAPYWDYSFPSVLKIYIEHVSANNIAYRYTDKGHEGLCSAKKLLYITTAGGFIGELDFGTDYFEGICKLYGIPQFNSLKAEALDVFTDKVDEILEASFKEAEELAKNW